MRPSTSSTAAGSAHGGFWHWNSPVAYVFVGLAFMLGLITVSLIILACSSGKSFSNSSTSEAGDEKSAKQVEIQVEFEPSIVVIMAGDDSPTYLAHPVSCNCPREQV
ncbi:protein GLUTAMINE DUMPER 4-like [Populus alba x Populus x berolinensis]|nr:protein GLUTAMINE DUMPER 4-like [Populus alba x Populus x berolinensis]